MSDYDVLAEDEPEDQPIGVLGCLCWLGCLATWIFIFYGVFCL